MKNSSQCRTAFDAVIVGGGAVGTLMALLLSKDENLKIALIDPVLTEKEVIDVINWTEKSRRVSALNYNIFHNLQKILNVSMHELVVPMNRMHVYTSEFGGNFELNAQDYGKEALAYVADNTQLTAFFRSLLPDSVHYIAESVNNVKHMQNRYELDCDHQKIITGILIGADGARSTLKDKLLIKKNNVGDPAEAFGGQLRIKGLMGADIARQWFLSDGSVLGLLPLKRSDEQQNIMSMVWSQPIVSSVNTWTESELEEKLNTLISQVTKPGDVEFDFVTKPQKWPLRRSKLDTSKMAENFSGLFFVGDAAHTIHPLAGQGMNLGLDDVIILHEKLQEYFSDNSVSLKNLSCQYHAQRAFSVNNMMKICEIFKNGFEQKSWFFKGLSAFAFSQFNHHTIIKRKIVEMMSF